MKQKGTVWMGLLALVFAATSGVFFTIYIRAPEPKSPGSYLALSIVFGLFALGAYGVSRIEDDQAHLATRQREAQEAYDKKMADIRRRAAALDARDAKWNH